MKQLLFEVSWEVCNKIGGIYTVLHSKIHQAAEKFGDNYILIGPDLDQEKEFVETEEAIWHEIRPLVEAAGLKCRFGRWNKEGNPLVILVNYKGRYDERDLLFSLWKDFGVDSFGSTVEYVEPVMFGTACGEVIEIVYNHMKIQNVQAVAHFHEWLTGAGLLYIKKNVSDIGTVFTTHSTSLGRALAGSGTDLYLYQQKINPTEDAKRLGVTAKHSLESTSAREADCFTTISKTMAEETKLILGKTPDRILQHGLNIQAMQQKSAEDITKNRLLLLDIAGKFIQKNLASNTQIWVTSGLYEFNNMGYNVLLDSLGKLEEKLKSDPNAPAIVVLILIAAGHLGLTERARRLFYEESNGGNLPAGLATHRPQDEQNDPIIQGCLHNGLRNSAENKINVIFSPAYLDGHDGVFNLPYYDILASSDLTIFPSFYEPWGYRPLESVAYGIPTISTDLSGFANWVMSLHQQVKDPVMMVYRKGKPYEVVVTSCTDLMDKFLHMSDTDKLMRHQQARILAQLADWKLFYKDYSEAYEIALQKGLLRINATGAHDASGLFFTSFSDTGSREPRFRAFTVAPVLPAELARLEELAYNMWWSWQLPAQQLFEELSPELWVQVKRNPIKMINMVPYKVLHDKAKDSSFISRYLNVVAKFDAYMKREKSQVELNEAITPTTPVAYFSMEYGLHECLPIYSGGLGILSGDHLKSASDLNFPLIAVGLLYKNGYFVQEIDHNGQQVAYYPLLDCSLTPIKILQDKNHKEAKIILQLPGRQLFARIWLVQVGKVALYLLDTDIQDNIPADREITKQLYGGDRKTRIKQEILLGMGGIQLIREVLKIKPASYHLNEGHSAFLLIERIRRFMHKANLSFQEAREAVKLTSVFTTHTPVPAGNEAFDVSLIKYYFEQYVQDLGISFEQFIELGQIDPHTNIFSMTIFALKLTSQANGVSQLHGKVSQDMWRGIWPGLNLEDVPINAITNGIHLCTWVGPEMKQIFHELGMDCDTSGGMSEHWGKMNLIPDQLIWFSHQEQKSRLINHLKTRLKGEYIRRGETPEITRKMIDALSPDTLLICFARRAASYKRAYLMFQDMERLATVLKDTNRPVVILIAGKAHPADGVGQDILKKLLSIVRDRRLEGRLIFIENYDMHLASLLVQGVDVWLNTPIFLMEASGTSGMKAGSNGVINLSVLDGWWYEAYNPEIGWGIFSEARSLSPEYRDQADHVVLMDILENQVVPLYYSKEKQEFSQGWVKMMRESIKAIASYFNTNRMVSNYYDHMYTPAAQRGLAMFKDNYQSVKDITEWKKKIRAKFSTMRIKNIRVEGINGDVLVSDQPLRLELIIDRGKMEKEEILAELMIGLRDGDKFVEKPETISFKCDTKDGQAAQLKYSLSYKVKRNGTYNYGIRLMPRHQLLYFPHETGLIYWA